MKKAGGILGLIGGVFGVFAALFTLFFGGIASAFSANGASTVVGLGWGGIAFSFLAIIFGAVCLGAQSKWPAAMLTIGSILGAIFGGTFVAICMALSLVGGILALAGTRTESGAGSGRGWAVGGGLAMAALVAALFVGGGQHAAKPTAPASGSSAAPAPAAAPGPVATPQFKVGETFQGKTFRITVSSAAVTDGVGDGFMRSTPAAGGEYVAVAWSYTNISSAPVDAWNAPRLKLVDPAGHVYDADLGATGAFAGQVSANAKVLSNVNPGITISDADVFEVSKTLFDPRTWKLRVRSQDGDALVGFAAAARPQAAASLAGAASMPATPQSVSVSVPDQPASDAPAKGRDVALAGTILIGHDKFASGTYTYFHADAPFTSPCDASNTQDVLLWNSRVGDPLILKTFAGQHVVLHGTINCPNSGIQFAPDSANHP